MACVFKIKKLRSKMRFLAILVIAVLLVVALSFADEGNAEEIVCTCAVFGEKGADQISGKPLMTKSINFESECNEQGAKDCALLCKSIAQAGAAQENQELCQAIGNTQKPLRPTIYSKICDDKVWTYAELTASKDYCCKEGKHVPNAVVVE